MNGLRYNNSVYCFTDYSEQFVLWSSTEENRHNSGNWRSVSVLHNNLLNSRLIKYFLKNQSKCQRQRAEIKDYRITITSIVTTKTFEIL